MRKNPKKSIWMKRPATIIFSPMCSNWRVPAACIPPPIDCTKNDTQSPVTNIFVSHFNRIIECFPPSTSSIRRPRTIYMVAARSAGAIRMSNACMTRKIQVSKRSREGEDGVMLVS